MVRMCSGKLTTIAKNKSYFNLIEFSLSPELIPMSHDKNEMRKLQDEVNTLTKKNGELEGLISRKEMIVPKDMVDGAGDSNKLRELEKNCRQLKLEKDEMAKVKLCSKIYFNFQVPNWACD
jgi:hypothetical protein